MPGPMMDSSGKGLAAQLSCWWSRSATGCCKADTRTSDL